MGGRGLNLTKAQKWMIGGASAVGVAGLGDWLWRKYHVVVNPVVNPATTAASVAMTAAMTAATVAVGQTPSASVALTNSGGAAATVSVSGVTTYQGATVGNWVAQSVIVPAGQSATLTMQTQAPVAANFAGDTLQVVFTGSSSASSPITAQATFTVAAVQIPQVTGITSTPTSSTTGVLAWQAAQGVTGAQYVLRHVDASGNVVATNMGNVAPQVTIPQTSITVSQLTAGAVLDWEVAVVAGGQTGPWSTVQTLQMPAAPATPTTPATPTGLRPISSTTSSITFEWNPVQGADTIQLGHVVNGSVVAILQNVGGTAVQATASGLNANFPETVAVRAGLNGQMSPFSAPVTGQTQAATTTNSGGGVTPVPTPTPTPVNTSQCASLLASLSAATSQAATIRAHISSLQTQWNNTFMNYSGTTAGKEAALAAITSQINAAQTQLASVSANGIAIAQRMSAAGCG